ncbi:Glutaredoxin domain and Thioredoxin-like fold domain-containing protein [Aphelenchoides fujianensis]|nr:Glutaredoxin domain and Thioredoxin-like fold domain-containing protein [Aphelenchoides fujianensis]
MVARRRVLLATVAVLAALVHANNLTLAKDFDSLHLDDEVRLRRHVLADDAQIAMPDSQLKAFKSDSQKTGSVLGGDQQMSGYGGGSFWSGYGAAEGPDMQMGQEQYQQPYGQMPGQGAIGTPNSPYAGYLEKQIASYPVMIYTLNECMPCQRAKSLLATNYPDVRAHYLELSGNEPWQQQLQIDLQYLTGAMTFPYIFVCGQYIGGASDLFDLHENNQLRRMVTAPNCVKTPKF